MYTTGRPAARKASGNDADQERYVDLGFGMLAGSVAEAAVSMQKVVLHVHYQESRFFDFRADGNRLHFAPPSMLSACYLSSHPSSKRQPL